MFYIFSIKLIYRIFVDYLWNSIMSSVKVVDLNIEAVEEATPIPETIEETKQEPEHEVSCSIREPVVDTTNEIIEETNEQPKEAPKEEVKEKPKRQTQKGKINCGKCGKEMTIKSYKYSHEKNCQGQLSERPVKPQTKPKAKQAPKPKPVPVYEEEEEQHIPQQVIRQQPPPIVNPITNIQQHYQLLQQQYLKQKQEKYNNLCQNMFKTKLKKR